MKIAVILLAFNRNHLTKQVIDQNFSNAGYDADVYLSDNGSDEVPISLYKFKGINASFGKRGISAGFNAGLEMAYKKEDYEAVCILANDILMPDNWLQSWVTFYKSIPKTGIIGIHCVEDMPPLVNGIHITHTPFGNNFISGDLIKEIGGYNTDYDPYGMQDRDYAERATIAGYINYYVPNMQSVHIGHDVGENSDYRRIKDESLARAQSVWEKYQPIYHNEKQLYANFSANK